MPDALNATALRYIGAVTREVETRNHEGKAARVVIAGCSYDTNIEDVWDALTNAERIPRWFLPISGELRVGGRFQLQGNAGGEIRSCQPPSNFEITWEHGGQISWVRIGLTPLADGGTSLRLEHIAHVPDEFWNQFGPGAVGIGWDLGLMGLGRHLSSGATADPKQAEAWMFSDEGRDFIQGASKEWGKASIASGVEETAANEAAARTTAFYTGQSC